MFLYALTVIIYFFADVKTFFHRINNAEKICIHIYILSEKYFPYSNSKYYL